jgi:hypothetical protein
MVIGAHGVSGKLVPLPVAEEHVQKSDSVITRHRKAEEKAVIRMDLRVKNLKVVTADLVLVYESF